MIAYLRGKITYLGEGVVYIDVNGVGYKLFIAKKDIADLKLDDEVKIYTYQVVKEDELSLYGFAKQASADVFQILISVSGIGPKTGLQVLEKVALQDLQDAIIKDSPLVLTKISGIGQKTAERIILELKGKKALFALASSDLGSSSSVEDIEVLEALESLGYPIDEIRKALRNLDKEVKGTENKIKELLKILSNGN